MRSWTHLKRGGKYVEVGPARLQTDAPLADMEPLLVYRGEDGSLWARPPSEFEGRFQVVREVEAEDSGFHLNSSQSVAVADDIYYFPMSTCPRSVKLLLLGPGRVATLAIYDGDPQWLGWFPLPKERK